MTAPVIRPKPNHPLCGTPAGYKRHRRVLKSSPKKEPACLPCTAANARDEQKRYHEAKARKAAS